MREDGLRPSLTLVRGEGPRPWPRDSWGRLLPRRPLRGLRIDVVWGPSAASFDRWRLDAVRGHGFRATCGVRVDEQPLEAWEAWLGQRLAEGRVIAHAPGCRPEACHGCRFPDPHRPSSRLRLMPGGTSADLPTPKRSLPGGR